MGQSYCSATTLRRASLIPSRASTTGIVVVYVQYAYMIYNRCLCCVLRRHAHTNTCHHVPPHTAPRVRNRSESRLKQHGLLRGTFNFKEWADTVLDPDFGGLGCGSIHTTKISAAHVRISAVSCMRMSHMCACMWQVPLPQAPRQAVRNACHAVFLRRRWQSKVQVPHSA